MKAYSINKNNVVSDSFPDEVVIINLENGNYYSLNGIGMEIWEMLESPILASQIEEILVKRYRNEDPSRLSVFINKTITDLDKEELLTIQGYDKNKTPELSPDNYKSKRQNGKKLVEGVLERYTDMQDFLLVDPIHEVDYENWPKAETENAKIK